MKLKLHELNANIKYKIMHNIYPEIDKIFAGDKFSHDFITSDIAHNAQKKLDRYYDKYLMDIDILYQDYLYKIATLINNIEYDPNIIEIMYIYGYLLYNGYLSHDNKFNFLFADKELQHKPGVNIMYGTGVCRNIGSLFGDLLNLFDIENYGIMTDRETFEFEKINFIEKFYSLFNIDADLYTSQFTEERKIRQNLDPNFSPSRGNHYEIIAKSQGWKLLDPTNLALYSLNDRKTNYPALRFIRPWSFYSLGKHSLRDTVKLYHFLGNKYLNLYNGDKILNLQEEIYKKCEESKQKIIKFHSNITPHLNYINKIYNESK